MPLKLNPKTFEIETQQGEIIRYEVAQEIQRIISFDLEFGYFESEKPDLFVNPETKKLYTNDELSNTTIGGISFGTMLEVQQLFGRISPSEMIEIYESEVFDTIPEDYVPPEDDEDEEDDWFGDQ